MVLVISCSNQDESTSGTPDVRNSIRLEVTRIMGLWHEYATRFQLGIASA